MTVTSFLSIFMIFSHACIYEGKLADGIITSGRLVASTSTLAQNRESCESGQLTPDILLTPDWTPGRTFKTRTVRGNPGRMDIPDNRVDTSDNLRRLRLRMKASSYDAYIIPSDDEHQSEYTAPYDKRREFISGFSGSAGIAVVLQNKAALWTDGRYFLQAEQELDCNWFLMKSRNKGVPKVHEWLLQELVQGAQIGADSKLISYATWISWKEKLESGGLVLVEDKSNLIDDIWSIGQGRVPESVNHMFIHDIKYNGQSWQDKVIALRKILQENGNINGTIITALDEISWFFNLRGNEVPYTPVFKSYAFVSDTYIRLYVKSLKLTDAVRKHLASKGCNDSDCVQIKEYSEIFSDLAIIIANTRKIKVSPSSSYAIVNLVPKEQRELNDDASVVSTMRAVKNDVEIQGMKNANIRDGVAIVDFISMLEKQINEGVLWDEMKAVRVLTSYRRQQDLFHSQSFPAISASGSNAAVIHYFPQPSTNKTIDNEHIYLLDSGGQYLDGTTDITRTFHFGQPSDFEKEAYTRVLKGAIDLVTAVFPEGIRDTDLDMLARQPLHKAGLDYLHGTGHGIGIFLSVHEAPILLRSASTKSSKGFPLKAGMFMSDEPGYYEAGKFGIRLETVIMVVNANTRHKFNDRQYYTFEPVTFVPFEPKLMNLNLLSKKQKEWLNDYNYKVRNTLGLELRRQKRDRALQWLLSRTELISVDCASYGEKTFDSRLLLTVSIFVYYVVLR